MVVTTADIFLSIDWDSPCFVALYSAIVTLSVLVFAKGHFEISLVLWFMQGFPLSPSLGVRFRLLGAQVPGCSGTYSNCPLFVSGVIPWAHLLSGERT